MDEKVKVIWIIVVARGIWMKIERWEGKDRRSWIGRKIWRRIWENIGSNIWRRIGRKEYNMDRIIDYRRRVEMRTKTLLDWNPNRKINRLERDKWNKSKEKYCNSPQNKFNINIQYMMFEKQTRHQRTKTRDKTPTLKFEILSKKIYTMTERDHGWW